MRTAFFVDGGFYLKRLRHLCGEQTPREAARSIYRICVLHLKVLKRDPQQLYRTFVYDCPPLTKKAHNPISGRSIDFSRTPIAEWRFQFHDELRKMRKVALRLGHLNERGAEWVLRPDLLKQLLSRQLRVEDLSADDVMYRAPQKGVDMRIGLDIAALSYKRLVDQIVLVAGDSDFVPAAKLARREGIDFILDPMWADIRPELREHIDGLQSVLARRGGERPASHDMGEGTPAGATPADPGS